MSEENKVRPEFIHKEKSSMLKNLQWVVKDLKRYLKDNNEAINELMEEVPSIDVRLCIDEDSWIFRTGSADYDPYHSLICSASSVQEDTEAEELLEELLNQAFEQCSD